MQRPRLPLRPHKRPAFALFAMLALVLPAVDAAPLITDTFDTYDTQTWAYSAHAGAAPSTPLIVAGSIVIDNGTANSSNRAALLSLSTAANPFVSPLSITLNDLVLETTSTTATSIVYVIIGREETDVGDTPTVAQIRNYGSTGSAPYDGPPSGTESGALTLNLFRNNATGVHTLVVNDLGSSVSGTSWTLNGAPSAITWVVDGTAPFSKVYHFTLNGAQITSRPGNDLGADPSIGSGSWAVGTRFDPTDLIVGDYTVCRIAVGVINAGNLSAGCTSVLRLGGIQVTDTSAPTTTPPPDAPALAPTQVVFGFDVGGSTPLSFFPGATLGVEWSTGTYSSLPSGAQTGDAEDLAAGTPGRLSLPAFGAFTEGLIVDIQGFEGITPTVPSPFFGGGFSLMRPKPTAFYTGDSLVLTFQQDVEVKNIAFFSAAPTETVEISVAGNVIYSGSGYHLPANPLDLGRVPLPAGQALRILATASGDGFHLSTLTIAAPDTADAIELPKLLASGSVLQRDTSVPVWGRAFPGETVTIAIKNQLHTVVADFTGHFEIPLDPEPAGGPFTLAVSGSVSGAVTSTNLYFGDVWLCSGQSNMWYRLVDHLAQYPSAYGPIPAPDDNREDLRFAMLATETATAPRELPTLYIPWSPWKNIPLQAGAQFTWISATPYFFGKALRSALDANGQADVPLGIVISAFGGTSIEQWIAPDPLTAAGPWVSGAISPALASNCYHAMIAPLERFPIKGALWYQGENNSGNLVRTAAYARLQETLASSWRAARGDDFPFYFVQLAGYMRHAPIPTENDASAGGYNINWAWIREAQAASAATIPNSGMVVAIDTGDQTNIHPSGKDLVGQRLALLAQADVYGLPVAARSPAFVTQQVTGAEVMLTFDQVAGGLRTQLVNAQPDATELAKNVPAVRAPADFLRGFALAGADRVFHHATHAEIVGGNQIRLSNPADVPAPVAVRYAWQSFPNANLFGGTGLPVGPFRTDTFAPGSSFGADSSPLAFAPPAARRIYNSTTSTALSLDLSAVFRDLEDGDAGHPLAFAVTANSAPDLVTSATVSGSRLDLSAAPIQGAATLSLRATDSAGRSATATLTVAVELSTFAAWQHRHFSAAELADLALKSSRWGAEADPDADGRPNLLEYALASSPFDADTAEANAAPLTLVLDDSGRLVARYRRAKALATDPAIALTLETSTELGAPASWSALDAPETLHADLGEAELRDVLLPADAAPRRFVRLTVTRVP